MCCGTNEETDPATDIVRSCEIHCRIFVYGKRLADETLRSRFPQCTFVRQEGLWMHHLRALPAKDVSEHDYVLLMIDGVEMQPDVDAAVAFTEIFKKLMSKFHEFEEFLGNLK